MNLEMAMSIALHWQAKTTGKTLLEQARYLLEDEKKDQRSPFHEFTRRARLWLQGEIHRLELEGQS